MSVGVLSKKYRIDMNSEFFLLYYQRLLDVLSDVHFVLLFPNIDWSFSLIFPNYPVL